MALPRIVIRLYSSGLYRADVAAGRSADLGLATWDGTILYCRIAPNKSVPTTAQSFRIASESEVKENEGPFV